MLTKTMIMKTSSYLKLKSEFRGKVEIIECIKLAAILLSVYVIIKVSKIRVQSFLLPYIITTLAH